MNAQGWFDKLTRKRKDENQKGYDFEKFFNLE